LGVLVVAGNCPFGQKMQWNKNRVNFCGLCILSAEIFGLRFGFSYNRIGTTEFGVYTACDLKIKRPNVIENASTVRNRRINCFSSM
jgi:hypothetical protein